MAMREGPPEILNLGIFGKNDFAGTFFECFRIQWDQLKVFDTKFQFWSQIWFGPGVPYFKGRLK